MTGDASINMCYKSFSSTIRKPHRIILVGWPSLVPLDEPGRSPVPIARVLLERWRTGSIHFERVSLDELARIEAEEAVKKRKVRSDKGVTREPRGPETRGKPKWSNGRVTSRPVISDSEDEDEIEEYSD